MSLSRFQTALWSVLILSALLAVALTNLPHVRNPTDVLSISIPPQLSAFPFVLAVLAIMTALQDEQKSFTYFLFF